MESPSCSGMLMGSKRLHFYNERTIALQYFEDPIASTLASMDH